MLSIFTLTVLGAFGASNVLTDVSPSAPTTMIAGTMAWTTIFLSRAWAAKKT
jgi:hypothetical protein